MFFANPAGSCNLLNSKISSLSKNKNKLLLQVPKLEDAHFAGNKDVEKSMKCTLVLTEGDSAKALAIALHR